MKYRNIIIALLLSLLSVFSSCSSLKNSIDNTNRIVLNDSNIKLLDGKYSIRAIDGRASSLDSYIFGNNLKYLFGNSDSLSYIKLEVVDEKMLNISYAEDSGKIKTRKIKGKLENGYSILKRSHLFFPFIFTNFYRNSLFRIGLLNNGNLITDYSDISFGTVMVIWPFGGKTKDFDIEFKKMRSEKIQSE